MPAAILVALFVAGLTPEEEVEAWQPWQPAVAQADEESDHGQAGVRVATVIMPLVGILAGSATGFGAAYALQAVGLSGTIAAWSGLLIGVGGFDAVLALGLYAVLPEGLPSWTIPVAVISGTVAGAAGLVLSSALSFAYVSVQYAGSDCYCGQDLLLIPVVIGGMTAAGAVAGTTLAVMAAELE